MTLSLDPPDTTPCADSTPHAGLAPRVLYVDAEGDLPTVLDRVEEDQSPAVLVLHDNARPLRGPVAARLLQRRARAAGVQLVVVTADRATVAQLRGVGIPTAQTVGEGRRLLAGPDQVISSGRLPAWESTAEGAVEDDAAPLPAAEAAGRVDPHLIRRADDAQAAVREGEVVLDAEPATQVRIARGARAPARRAPLRLVVVACLMVLAAVLIWGFAFARATVVISYTPEAYSHTYHLAAGPGSPVPIHTTHLQESAALTVPATGSRDVPDARATGTITLANPLSGTVEVPAGTVVRTSSGVLFSTESAVAVPAAIHSFSGSTNGQQTVVVVAEAAGPGGNVPAGSISALEGRLAGVLLVTNYGACTGGTTRTVYHITAQDIAAAATVLSARLKAREAHDLHQRFARSPGTLITSTTVGPPSVTPVTTGSRLQAHVTVTVTTAMRYLHAQDVQTYTAAKRALAPATGTLVPLAGSVRASTQVAVQGGVFVLTTSVTATMVPRIDLENLRGLLAGRTIADARALLDGSARYGHWHYQVSTSPQWFGRLPQAPNLITIVLKRVPG